MLVALLSSAACLDGGNPGPLADLAVRPGSNVIVVSFDALRSDALGAYGSERGATPRLDAFAAESIVFENAYTASAVTPTSFAAFFSGRLPTKVFHAWRFTGRPSLAERFSSAGYRTAAFLNNVQLTDERGFDHGFSHYTWRSNVSDDALLDEALAWLDAHAGPGQPVFLWIHLLRPHAPYLFHREAAHLYRQADYRGRFEHTSGNRFEASEPADVTRLEDLYTGETWAADRTFGRLVDALRREDLLDSSLVVVTADHGEEFFEHGGFQHSGLYEEHLRIPLIVRHPGAGPQRIAATARSIDLMPTLLGLAGLPLDEPVDGADLSAEAVEPARPVIASITTGRVLVSIRQGDEKLIVSCRPTVGVELFDLASDPEERRDLSAQRPRRVRRMFGELRSRLGDDPCRQANLAHRDWESSEVSPETLEALRALGYLR